MSKVSISMMLILVTLLTGCSDTLERLKRIGRSPELATLDLPSEEHEDMVDKPRSERQRRHMRKTNSLWEPGATSFLRDHRAWRIGDILRVVVEINDSARLDNSSKHKRDGKDRIGLASLFGKQRTIAGLFAKGNKGKADSLLKTDSQADHSGSGKIQRGEMIRIEIAALVTKVLPNGNLVIQGHQEVRVNYELREVKVAGIIRPKDISSENSISDNQIAEARISYGGRGIVSDMQQPRVGAQVIDAISPF